MARAMKLGRRGRAAGLQGRAHRQEALRDGVLAHRGPARLDELSLCLVTDRAQTRGRDLVAVVDGVPGRRAYRPCRFARRISARPTWPPSAGASPRHARARGLADRERSGRRGPGRWRRRRAAHTRLAPRGRHPRVAGRRLRIGASVHSLDDAVMLRAQGADWVVFGPVYDTAAKRQYGAPQGLERLAAVPAPYGSRSSRSAASRPNESRGARGRRPRGRRDLGDPVGRLSGRGDPELLEGAGLRPVRRCCSIF